MQYIRASQQVSQLQSLDQVGVPDHRAILNSNLREGLVNLVNTLNTLVQRLLGTENGDVSLHDLLHVGSDLVGGQWSVGSADLVEKGDGLSTSISADLLVWHARLEVVADGMGDGTTEHNEIEEGVGTETVGSVDGNASGFTAGEETWNDLVLALLVNSKNLTGVLGWDTTHVVVHSWENWNWLLGDIDTGENGGSLRDTWETLVENISWEMAELEVEVILVWSDTTALADLHGHRAGDDVTGSEILSGWSITLHESLALRVEEIPTLTTSTLSDQASGTVDTSWVELNELQILVRETSTSDHSHSVTGTGVGGSAREVGSSVTSGGKNSVVCAESVESSILLVVGKDTLALAILHNQIESEVLNEVVGVVAEGLSVKSVKKGVSGSVGGGAASVSLSTLSEILRLSTESTLIDLSVLGSREWASVILQLNDGSWCLSRHVVNSILVSKPIRTLHGVVHVPSPVILVHVAKSGVDSSLCGYGVGSSWEELGNTSSVESSLGKTESCAKTSSTGTDDDGIILVVLYSFSTILIVAREGGTYDDWVFVGEERRCLLGAERSVCDDARCL